MPATKQKVTLSLNSEIYVEARRVLDLLPGSSSLSGLIDDMLELFVTEYGPKVAGFTSTDVNIRVNTLREFHSEQISKASGEFEEIIRKEKEKVGSS